jgi:hypothetical protein
MEHQCTIHVEQSEWCENADADPNADIMVVARVLRLVEGWSPTTSTPAVCSATDTGADVVVVGSTTGSVSSGSDSDCGSAVEAPDEEACRSEDIDALEGATLTAVYEALEPCITALRDGMQH